MNFSVEALTFFEKQLRRLIKKYPSLKNEYAELIDQLSDTPHTGTPLGGGCYKIRLGIASKGKGTSGGARVITCVKVVQSTVYLLTIYDKGEQDSITDKEVKELANQID